MISQEQFDKIEQEHGCGYWNLCWEHACPCAITVENKGLQESIWNSLCEENKEVIRQYELDQEDCNNKYIPEDDYDEAEYWNSLDEREDQEYECPFCHQVPTPSGRCDCSSI